MKIKINKKQQKIIILLGIFLSVLLLNYFVPLINDDYSYSFGLKGKLTGFIDIFKYQYHHYFHWGGRTIAHTLAQIFLMGPDILFDVCNSVIFTLLVYLIYKTVFTKKDNPLYLLLVYFTLWLILPVFGETCLWLIGSCNYMWTTTLILFFLIKYRNYKEIKDSKLNFILLFLLGILAGWTNENTSFGSITIIICYLIYQKYFKKEKIKKWELSGLVGNIIGFIIMIIAPGNFVRKESIVENPSLILRLGKRIFDITTSLLTCCLPLIIIVVALVIANRYLKKKIPNISIFYLIGAFFSTYSMALAPSMPERSFTGVIVFLVVAIISLLDNIYNAKRIISYLTTGVIVILAIFFVKDYLNSFQDLYHLKNAWNERVEYIEKEKKKGNLELKLYPIFPSTNKNPYYHSVDLSKDKDNWINEIIAKYYNLKSVEGIYE